MTPKELDQKIAEIEAILAELKSAQFKAGFDPENPTIEDIPLPWLVMCEDNYGFSIQFLVDNDNSLMLLNSSSDKWFNFSEVTPIPRSQWPELLIEQYKLLSEKYNYPPLNH